MRSLRKWLRRGAIGTAVTVVVLAVAGLSFQAVATRADHRDFPPPGHLVDVGGYRLHIQCEGAGSPTVVLETGALAMSALWGNVQPRVAVYTRVCSYDRAGLGWSESGPEPRDAVHLTDELHTLLTNAGERPPYVLVGHSYGGLLVPVYADKYQEEVTGIVLVDPSHPDQIARLRDVLGEPSFIEDDLLPALLPSLARLGILRFALTYTDGGRQFDGLGKKHAAEFKAFFARASHQVSGQAEMDVWEETAAQARAARALGELPLVVIGAGESPPISPERRIRLELHEELASLSSRGSFRILGNTTHGSLVINDEHAAQVAEVIREVVEASRTPMETD